MKLCWRCPRPQRLFRASQCTARCCSFSSRHPTKPSSGGSRRSHLKASLQVAPVRSSTSAPSARVEPYPRICARNTYATESISACSASCGRMASSSGSSRHIAACPTSAARRISVRRGAARDHRSQRSWGADRPLRARRVHICKRKRQARSTGRLDADTRTSRLHTIPDRRSGASPLVHLCPCWLRQVEPDKAAVQHALPRHSDGLETCGSPAALSRSRGSARGGCGTAGDEMPVGAEEQVPQRGQGGRLRRSDPSV